MLILKGLWDAVAVCLGKPKPTLMQRAVAFLQENDSATNRDWAKITNGPTWLTSDLRKAGYLMSAEYDRWEKANGKRCKRYFWSGKKFSTNNQ